MFFLLAIIGGIGLLSPLVSKSFRWEGFCLVSGVGLFFGLCCGGAIFLGFRYAGVSNLFYPGMVLFSIAGVICFLLRNRWKGNTKISGLGPDPWVILVVCFSIVIVILSLWVHPSGDHDAWAFWNLKARFVGLSEWKHVFDLAGFTHNDYPILLPAMIAASEQITQIGEWNTRLIHFGMFVSLGLVILSGYGFNHRYSHRLFSVFVLSAPFFLRHSASQYADLGVGVSVFLSVLLILNTPRGVFVHLLSGFFLGCAIWFKNEGALYGVAIFSLWILRFISPKKIGFMEEFKRDDFLGFIGGLFIPVAALVSFKMSLDVTSEYSQSGTAITEKIFSPERYFIIIYSAVIEMFSFRHWIFWIPLGMVIVFVRGWRNHLKIREIFVVLILSCSGFFFVYLISPNDLQWHIDTSMRRLLYQAWPLIGLLVAKSLEGTSFIPLKNSPA